jgi:hypothetical protein
MTTTQVIYAHTKVGAYNPPETTELIHLQIKISVPQKAHKCQIDQKLLPSVRDNAHYMYKRCCISVQLHVEPCNDDGF